jgi:hypothetical protein
MTVNQLVADLERTLDEYIHTHGKHYEEVLSKTKLNYDYTVASRHTVNTHIDFIIPDDDRQKANQCMEFIARECRLRGIHLNMQGGVKQWHAQLRESVVFESKIAWKNEGILKVPLVHYVELLIPCILHLENRVGEKLLTMILRIGMDHWPSTHNNCIIGHFFEPKSWGWQLHQHTGVCLTKGKVKQTYAFQKLVDETR